MSEAVEDFGAESDFCSASVGQLAVFEFVSETPLDAIHRGFREATTMITAHRIGFLGRIATRQFQ